MITVFSKLKSRKHPTNHANGIKSPVLLQKSNKLIVFLSLVFSEFYRGPDRNYRINSASLAYETKIRYPSNCWKLLNRETFVLPTKYGSKK